MNTREKLFVFVIGVALGAAVFAGLTNNDGTVDVAQDGEVVEPAASPVRDVHVVNLDTPHEVTGAVEVANFPPVQAVQGTVEVANLPDVQQVEVVNPEPPATLPRFQLVGFTFAALPADSGIFGFTAACQLEYPSSRMCTLSEAIRTTTIPDLSVGEEFAWIDPDSGKSIGDLFEGNCYGWIEAATSIRGMVIEKNGAYGTSSCGQVRSAACCAPVE